MTGKTLGENIDEYDIRRKTASAGARLLAQVRAGGKRTNKAWTVPSVSAENRSQAAGLALLDAEGEVGDGDSQALGNGHGSGSNRHGDSGDGFDASDVIRTVEHAYSTTGGLTMLKGNLAPWELSSRPLESAHGCSSTRVRR